MTVALLKSRTGVVDAYNSLDATIAEMEETHPKEHEVSYGQEVNARRVLGNLDAL